MARAAFAVGVKRAAPAEVNGLRVLDALDLPRKAFAQPGVGFLDLVAVLDALMKHAVVVANAVADDGQAEGRAAVEEAGRQAAETAVAEAGVMLAFVHILELQPEARECFGGFVFDAEIEQRVAQQAAHQEFE